MSKLLDILHADQRTLDKLAETRNGGRTVDTHADFAALVDYDDHEQWSLPHMGDRANDAQPEPAHAACVIGHDESGPVEMLAKEDSRAVMGVYIGACVALLGVLAWAVWAWAIRN